MHKLKKKPIQENVRQGIGYGFRAFTIYAMVECWFAVVFPWIIDPNSYQTRSHWGFTVFLIFVYMMIGIVVGIGTGAVFTLVRHLNLFKKVKASTFFSAISTLILILIFDVILILNYATSSVESLGLSELPPLAMSLLMIFGLFISVFSQKIFARFRFLTNPWTACIVLLGLPWIYHEVLYEYSRALNVAVALVYILGIVMASFVVVKLTQKRFRFTLNMWTRTIASKHLFMLLIVMILFQGFIFISKKSPPSLNLKTGSSPPGHEFPNIILITMDTVRSDHLSLYGYSRDTTPNLKKLSEEMTLFTHLIASGAMTLSTHASIFTGMYSRQHGAHLDPWNDHPFGRPLAEKFKTLAEILSDVGYFTGGIVSNPNFLSHFYGLDQGFQYYDSREYIPFLSQTKPYQVRHLIREALIPLSSREAFDMRYRRAEEINREVYRLLDKLHKKEAPFFLFINYMDAHNPYIPPSPFDMLFPGKDETFTSARYYTLGMDIIKGKRKIPEEVRNHLISQYDGAIAYIDFHIGQLIEQLNELGLYENSLIIVTSDHGEAFGEKNLFNHGVSVYQDQVHVPLIIKYPNINQKHVVEDTVSVIDLMPTILGLIGEDMPIDSKGKTLLKQDSKTSRVVISETYPSGSLVGHHEKFNRIECALFSGFYKFISSTKGKKEIYFLPDDPDENINIYRRDDPLSQKLEEQLDHWLKLTEPEYESSMKSKPDKETLERLKALGYIR